MKVNPYRLCFQVSYHSLIDQLVKTTDQNQTFGNTSSAHKYSSGEKKTVPDFYIKIKNCKSRTYIECTFTALFILTQIGTQCYDYYEFAIDSID